MAFTIVKNAVILNTQWLLLKDDFPQQNCMNIPTCVSDLDYLDKDKQVRGPALGKSKSDKVICGDEECKYNYKPDYKRESRPKWPNIPGERCNLKYDDSVDYLINNDTSFKVAPYTYGRIFCSFNFMGYKENWKNKKNYLKNCPISGHPDIKTKNIRSNLLQLGSTPTCVKCPIGTYQDGKPPIDLTDSDFETLKNKFETEKYSFAEKGTNKNNTVRTGYEFLGIKPWFKTKTLDGQCNDDTSIILIKLYS